jgi:hypothetical protein
LILDTEQQKYFITSIRLCSLYFRDFTYFYCVSLSSRLYDFPVTGLIGADALQSALFTEDL